MTHLFSKRHAFFIAVFITYLRYDKLNEAMGEFQPLGLKLLPEHIV